MVVEHNLLFTLLAWLICLMVLRIPICNMLKVKIAVTIMHRYITVRKCVSFLFPVDTSSDLLY